MKTSASALNPFVLMLDPEAVLSTIEGSAGLQALRQRICRPLDKPLIPRLFDRARDFDALIDAESFLESGSDYQAEAQPALHAVH
jgi:hypothetical protein